MALKGWATTPNCLRITSALVSAVPFSIAAWCLTSVTATAQMICGIFNSGNNTETFALEVNTTSNVAARSRAGGVNSSATTSTAYAASTWFHAAGVFAGATSRAAYLNGGGKGTNTTSSTPGALNRTTIGLQDQSAASSPWGAAGTGQLAKVGIWNVALTDFEVFMLSQGANPLAVHPESLIAYVPLLGFGSPEADLSGRMNHFPLVGTLSYADDPPFLDDTLEKEWFDRAVVGQAFSPYWLKSNAVFDGWAS